MSPDCFLDTNVLFYAAMARFSEPAKYQRARYIMAETNFAVSGQVLQEFYVNAICKTERPLKVDEALAWFDKLVDRPFVPVDFELVKRAGKIADRYRISYWDAAIVAAAERLGAPVVYSEDLSNGQAYGSVRVVNPFASH